MAPDEQKGVHQNLMVCIMLNIFDELPVNFSKIELKILEISKRCGPGPEIIQRKTNPALR